MATTNDIDSFFATHNSNDILTILYINYIDTAINDIDVHDFIRVIILLKCVGLEDVAYYNNAIKYIEEKYDELISARDEKMGQAIQSVLYDDKNHDSVFDSDHQKNKNNVDDKVNNYENKKYDIVRQECMRSNVMNQLIQTLQSHTIQCDNIDDASAYDTILITTYLTHLGIENIISAFDKSCIPSSCITQLLNMHIKLGKKSQRTIINHNIRDHESLVNARANGYNLLINRNTEKGV